MYVSSTPHETKVAVCEDDQLAEIFFERENEYTLAGSIYKGRVTRVLPGMQSAFVDIGLERDAFLYVSDFLDLEEEEDEEFEQVPVQNFVSNKPEQEPRTFDFQKDPRRNVAAAPPQGGDWVEEPVLGTPEAVTQEAARGGGLKDDGEGFRGGRRRRRGRRGRGFPETKFASAGEEESGPEVTEDFVAPPQASHPPIVLPGESISKYRGARDEGREHRNDGRGVRDERQAAHPSSQAGGESFVIEGGFEDSGPEFEGSGAPKQIAEPEPPVAQPVREEKPVREERKFTPAPQPTRIVLPGESIAKYQKSRDEGQGAKVEEQASVETVAPVAVPVHVTAPVQVTATVQRVNLPPAPFVLPGESISKYRNKVSEDSEVSKVADEAGAIEEPAAEDKPSVEVEAVDTPTESAPTESAVAAPATSESESGENEQERQPKPVVSSPVLSSPQQDEPRAEVRMEQRSTVAPFILPGESLAKYRRTQEKQSRTLQAEIDRQPEEKLAQEAAEMVASNEPLAVTLEREIASEPAPEAAEQAAAVPEPIVSEHGAVGGTTEPAATSASTSPVEDERAEVEHGYEEMNVASAFGGDEAAKDELQASEDHGTKDENQDEHQDEDQRGTEAGQSTGLGDEDVTRVFIREAQEIALDPAGNQFRHPFAPGEGDLEEEEIDEEDESDYRMYAHEEDGGDYVELEEETLEAQQREWHAPRAANGDQIDANGLTEAIKDEIIDEETSEAAYPANGEELEDEGGEESEEADVQSGGTVAPAAGTPEYRRGARPRFDPRRGGRPGRHGGPERGPERGSDRGTGGRPMRSSRREQPRVVPLISDLLKEGQEVLIQIAKEPIGKKGARITSHIALPGRFLVYMPTVNHIGVSRKINSDEERQRLKRIMISEREGGHGGFIVRTAAAGVGEDELRADIRFLKTLWADIKHRFETGKAPALIYHDLNLVERILRDQVTSDFSALWVDTEQEYERLVRFANRFQPSLVRKIKLYTKSTPLFEQFNIQPELDKALKSKVWLKSGGYIVINQTEALVAIDINTGKYVGKTARLEDTIVKTNIDAIKEIVRQIRLRDLGGIIVIDFIDMDERKNRQRVMQALEEALRADRAPSKVLQFNDFGLVAITRKRVKQSLERTLGEPCSHCEGTGLVKSVTTVCNEIYVEMRKMSSAGQLDRGDVMIRVNPEVAKMLKGQGARWMQEMEEMTQKNILVKSDPLLHQENFDIEG